MPELALPSPAERNELELPPGPPAGGSTAPLSGAPPTETPMEISNAAEDPGNGQGILLPLILIILAIYFFGPTSWRSFLRTAKDNILEEVKITASRLQTPKTVETAPPVTPVPALPLNPEASSSMLMPGTGLNRYTDEVLGYGFDYPETLSLYKCPSDLPCASIEKLSLKVEPLEPFFLLPPDPKASLLSNDLFCSAGGPTGSIECQNTKVDDFINSLGVQGFKIDRKKTVTGTGSAVPPGQYNDIAYVFPLQKIIKDQGSLTFSGILFAVDVPTPANLTALAEIANSFFNLPSR